MNKNLLKWLSFGMVAILVLNIVYVLSIKRNFTAFWIIIAMCAVYAYLVLPRLKGK